MSHAMTSGVAVIELKQILRDPAERLERLTSRKVADVLADEDLGADAQGHAVFQMRAYGENTGKRILQDAQAAAHSRARA